MPLLSGSVGGDDGIGGVGGESVAATSSEMQQAIGTWNRDKHGKGMMLSIATQHGDGFFNFNRMCLAEGQKEQDAATAAVAQDQARKRKAVGEKCACDICGKKYYVLPVSLCDRRGDRHLEVQRGAACHRGASPRRDVEELGAIGSASEEPQPGRGGWRCLSQLYLSFTAALSRLYFSCVVALSRANSRLTHG